MSARRCAVLGSPIAHSLSPVLHRAAYAELGLDWTYDAVEVREGELASYLEGLDESWRGVSLTMPLKRAVLPLLDEVSERAAMAGGANTVIFEDGRRVGDNTDIPGARAALRERYAGPVSEAVVLGGGATAASVLLALADLDCRHASLLVRDPARAEETVAAVRRHPTPPAVEVGLLSDAGSVGEVDVVVSTIPANAQTGHLVALVDRAVVVFDVLYHPWPTPLAAAASAAGRPLVGGLDLLVHQAALQVELMTGRPAPLSTMRAAGEAALGG